MSYYGDSPYNMSKEALLNEIESFLEEHPVSELISIVADAVEITEERNE